MTNIKIPTSKPYHDFIIEKLKNSEHPLRGKVIRYEHPYEPVAVEDWEALT